MSVKTYAPAEVAVIVGGIIIPDFENIRVSYDNDRFTFSEGSGGESTRVKSSSKLGTIEIELPQTTSANAALAGQDAVIKDSVLTNMLPFGITLFEDAMLEIIIQDTKGFSLHVMPQATLMKTPDAEYSKSDAGTRTWTFKGHLSKHIVAGN